MRFSTYGIILPLIGKDDQPVPGKALLVNGLYGAIDVVDEAVASCLRGGDLSGLSLSMRERLALRGHITRRDEEDELTDARLLGNIYGRTIGRASVGPVFLPTYDCNFRCPYCFEKHRLSHGKEWLSCGMSPEMVEAAFAGLKKLQEKGYRIDSCSLYGGEPLLKENKPIVRRICENAREMGLPLSAITNGYDLDAYIDLLEDFDFRTIQITVDGVGELNDRRRLHRDGLPTYERIMDHIRLALDHGISVSLRVNVNKENISGIKALMEDLAKRGLKAPSWEERERAVAERVKATDKKTDGGKPEKGAFNYYFKAVSEAQDSPNRVTEQEIMDAILQTGMSPLDAILHQSQYSMFLGPLRDAMTKESYPEFRTAFCGAESGSLIVAPDGLLYSCQDLVAMEEEAIGYTDVASGSFVYGFNKAKWRLRTSDRMEACRECPYIFLCRGGCAAEAKLQYGSYFRESCQEVRETFAFTASRVAGRRWEDTGEEELSVSLLGPLTRLTEEEREHLTASRSANEIVEILQNAGFLQTRQA